MLGCPNPTLRLGSLSEAKAGPLKTDQDFYIIKAPFPTLSIQPVSSTQLNSLNMVTHDPERKGKTTEDLDGTVYEVRELAEKIKGIRGVLEVGIFSGFTGPEAAARGLSGGEKPVACYFGQRDGTVTVRKARDEQ